METNIKQLLFLLLFALSFSIYSEESSRYKLISVSEFPPETKPVTWYEKSQTEPGTIALMANRFQVEQGGGYEYFFDLKSGNIFSPPKFTDDGTQLYLRANLDRNFPFQEGLGKTTVFFNIYSNDGNALANYSLPRSSNQGGSLYLPDGRLITLNMLNKSFEVRLPDKSTLVLTEGVDNLVPAGEGHIGIGCEYNSQNGDVAVRVPAIVKDKIVYVTFVVDINNKVLFKRIIEDKY